MEFLCVDLYGQFCVDFCGSFYVWISMGNYMRGSKWKSLSVDLHVELYVLIKWKFISLDYMEHSVCRFNGKLGVDFYGRLSGWI